MDKFVIKGGYPLQGVVTVSKAKNAALPILAAALLTEGKMVIKRCPRLEDVTAMSALLRMLGAKVRRRGQDVVVRAAGPLKGFAPYDIVRKMRASFCVLGPLVARRRSAKVSLPGGCVIGPRPVDLHLKGFRALGVQITIDGGYVLADASRLRGGTVYLGGPFGSSVGATQNVMMAATLAHGTTVIENAACEPEVVNLVECLVKMGARIKGAGSSRLEIRGVERLRGCTIELIPDRIEAGTFMLAAAATHGDVLIKALRLDHLHAVVDKLRELGVSITAIGRNACRVTADGRFKPVDVATLPYPGFPTDLQAQLMALLTLAEGASVITEKIYPDRFMHVAELARMGADIRKEGPHAIISGLPKLSGAPVMASDLRASAALVIAGLAAQGETEIRRVYHIDRGYEHIEKKLAHLGGQIRRLPDDQPIPQA
jgi:UDP-N-acetylglucosamine 1-carboxyvinyltransferase